MAALALFIVIGGTATAASGLIDGKKIKKGSVTAKQIKNKTITTAKLAPSAVSSLRGQAGPAGAPGQSGPAGTPGATGPTGASGVDGVVAPVVAENGTVNLPGADTSANVLEVDLPAGTYMVNARVSAISQAASNSARIGCSIAVDAVEDFDLADSVYQSPLSQNDEINLPLMAVTAVDDSLTVICSSDTGIAQVSRSRLIAVPVQG